MQLDPHDLDQLNTIVNDLYNITRRHGYPADLTSLFGEAQATLEAYRAEAANQGAEVL